MLATSTYSFDRSRRERFTKFTKQLEETMRKMILMAVTGFLWKKFKAHQASKTASARHRRD